MKFYYLVIILLVFNIFSCKTSNNKDKIKAEDTAAISKEELTAEGYLIITGSIHIGSNRLHATSSFVLIESEDGTEYFVYPPEIEEELKSYHSRLIKFTVIVLDEPKGRGGRRVVTPIDWEIIKGPPVIPPKITELGVIRITGVVGKFSPPGPHHYIIRDNERWDIKSGEDSLYDLVGCKVTVEGEGIIIDPGSPMIEPFPFAGERTLTEDEQNSLNEFGRRRELRNVKVIEVHNRVDI